MRRILFLVPLTALLFLGHPLQAQVPVQIADTLSEAGIGDWDSPDTVVITRTDTLFVTDTLLVTDTVVIRVVDSAMLRNVEQREALMTEKERFYKEIFNKSGIDQNKLEAERDRYSRRVDSLQALVHTSELENVRKDEANKYLEQRAREAEARVADATNKKKKVRAVQGIAMRFFRTPVWEVRLQPRTNALGQYDGTYDKTVRNRNAGNIEFDFVTGASVMLWDLTPYFNKNHMSKQIGETNLKTPELKKFDQDFAYDVGIYVGFGGSNLFKNFYVGPSFRFVDFFYFTAGINIAEYEVLVSGYSDGDIIPDAYDIGAVTAKAWLLKPFLALSIDLDFLSYIKK